MPAFKVEGNAVAGFAFFKSHCGYYPFSGSVVPALKSELDGYATSKSGVTFPPDKPLPTKLVKALVQAPLRQGAPGARSPARRGACAAAVRPEGAASGRLCPWPRREAHGGSIDVRSTAEEGTTFAVRLPRSP